MKQKIEKFEFNCLPALLVVRVASAEASPAAAKEFINIHLKNNFFINFYNLYNIESQPYSGYFMLLILVKLCQF